MKKPVLDWEGIADSHPFVPRHVVHRRFAAEAVLLNVETGRYYGMDEIGSRFFAVLGECSDIRSAVETLVQEFESPPARIQEDMVSFCAELLSMGLIELRGPVEITGDHRPSGGHSRRNSGP